MNAGLQRITEVVADVKDAAASSGVSAMTPAGDMLRLLTNLVKPFRDEGAALPALQDRVQNDLVAGLCSRMTTIADVLAAKKAVDDCARITVLLARIIHFLLGFQGVWTEEVLTLSSKLSGALTRLASVSAYCLCLILSIL